MELYTFQWNRLSPISIYIFNFNFNFNLFSQSLKTIYNDTDTGTIIITWWQAMDPWEAELVNGAINIELNTNITKTCNNKQNKKEIHVYSYLLQNKLQISCKHTQPYSLTHTHTHTLTLTMQCTLKHIIRERQREREEEEEEEESRIFKRKRKKRKHMRLKLILLPSFTN